MTITEVDLTVFFSLFYVVVFFCPFFFPGSNWTVEVHSNAFDESEEGQIVCYFYEITQLYMCVSSLKLTGMCVCC